MEPAQREFLSRTEITGILNERYLNIPTIELLPYQTLLHIYKTFAVPLERRETKRVHVTPIPGPEPLTEPPNSVRLLKEDLLAHSLIKNEHSNTYFDPHLLQQTKYLRLSFNTISNSAKKRESTLPIAVIDEATLAKRKSVPWQ